MRYRTETPHFQLSSWHMVCRVGLEALLREVRSGWVIYDWTSQSHSFDLAFCTKLTIIGYSIRIWLELFWCILCVIVVVQCDVTNQTPFCTRIGFFLCAQMCCDFVLKTGKWLHPLGLQPPLGLHHIGPFPQNIVQHEFEQVQHEPFKTGR